MRVALVQFNPHYMQVHANLDRVSRMIHGLEADLIVLPELFATGYCFHSSSDLSSVAEQQGSGPAIDFLRFHSESTGSTLVGGFPERDADAIYNSAAVATPDGRIDVYRKIHLFDREKLLFAPGNLGFPVFDVRDRQERPYRLGIMICFDWYFPEAARSLALQGADVIAHPANLVRKDCPRAMPIRALENHVFTVTANRTGRERYPDAELEFIGQSLICDPSGEVLAGAGRDEERILSADIDPHQSRHRQITVHNDLHLDRRPECYALGAAAPDDKRI
jgi:predicted amidohydrolase